MGYFHKLSESAGLVGGMAERLGIKLSDRIAAAPELETAAFAQLVRRCASCDSHAECTRLQDDNLMLDAAPDYCLNKDVFKKS